MKVGRNDLCPCNSGKKYKKCCLFKMDDLNRIKTELDQKILERREILKQLGIYIDFVVPTHFKENKVWALGSRLYPNQPKNETFHEFIVYVLKQELGREWWESQLKMGENEQHFIFKCFEKHYEWKQKNETQENKVGNLWRAVPDGYSRALTSLAFDVCSLLHAVHIPEIFLKKLRQYEGYQGVRYEIAIAAMFARMGYKIKFLDEEYIGQKDQPKHSEFIATNPNTKEEIAIEVKSKEREGVLHKNGQFNLEREFKTSVSKLFRHALQQKPQGKPFIVFIDMNLPLSPNTDPNDIVWVKSITKMRDSAAFASKGKKSPTNALVFTNYSYHYGTDKETSSGEWLLEKSNNPENPIISSDFGDKFISVLHKYGNIPNLDISVQI